MSRPALWGRLDSSARVTMVSAPEQAIRLALTLEATRWQYLTGAPDETLIDPDAWEHDLGDTAWLTVVADDQEGAHAAWGCSELPEHAGALRDRVAFAWRAMDAFYEEDKRIVGHAADPYHRIDIRQASRHLVVRDGDRVIAETTRPLALYESGFAPRWYLPREDVDEGTLALTARL